MYPDRRPFDSWHLGSGQRQVEIRPARRQALAALQRQELELEQVPPGSSPLVPDAPAERVRARRAYAAAAALAVLAALALLYAVFVLGSSATP